MFGKVRVGLVLSALAGVLVAGVMPLSAVSDGNRPKERLSGSDSCIRTEYDKAGIREGFGWDDSQLSATFALTIAEGDTFTVRSSHARHLRYARWEKDDEANDGGSYIVLTRERLAERLTTDGKPEWLWTVYDLRRGEHLIYERGNSAVVYEAGSLVVLCPNATIRPAQTLFWPVTVRYHRQRHHTSHQHTSQR